VRGKFLCLDGEKLYLRGVTYGTFRPRRDGSEFPELAVVERDFAAMAASGINTVRTYTVPPVPLLDAAAHAGLRVMVGLAAERYVGYLNDGRDAPDIEGLLRTGVRQCVGHPAVLGYIIGNEIPAGVVRWHGRRRIERYLTALWRATTQEDPYALVTYANYPSTEYLQLDFLDVVCFNVFLESPAQLGAYLKRLHNIAGDRPLVIGEIGLDSNRPGEAPQARCVEELVRTAFSSGSAGVFVYAWTDEWHTAAGEVVGWSFGLTRRDRSPKPSLGAVRAAFADVPVRRGDAMPRVSVVVCSYQGSRRIARCLDGIGRLEYPNFETIVVDDGSRDDTATVASRYADARVISTEHRGLSHARNVGMRAATGEIVAYIDDDAHPDPHWLDYLVHTFSSTDHAAVGGPNIAPPDSGLVAQSVACSPGNPTHVLLSDDEAEHIPGCNMAFRRSRLMEVGGFDPRFLAAGDDVDICWRLRERGWTIGFSPTAMVWHDPRSTLQTYMRQQAGYGRAEGLLEQKWPERYNAAGQASWGGRVYGATVRPLRWGVGRIYHGVWGQAPFQSVYEPAARWGLLALTPEWYLGILVLAVLSAAGALWKPLLVTLAALTAGVGASLVQAVVAARRARLEVSPHDWKRRVAARSVVALLHLLQPAARLRGRVSAGLTPWRRVVARGHALPLPYRKWFWSERWQAPDAWVRSIEERLRDNGATVLRGGDFDRFDLEVRGGTSGAVRLLMAVEEHGAGRQLVRIRMWPHWSRGGRRIFVLGLALAAGAALDSAWTAAALAAFVALAVAARAGLECASAAAAARRAVRESLDVAATTPRRFAPAG
jgi:GT2 family glycosyltransferase